MKRGIAILLCLNLLMGMQNTTPSLETEEITEIKVEINTDMYVDNFVKIEPPTYDELLVMDMREPCGLTLEQLEMALPEPMKELAPYYLEQEEYGLNAVFKASMDSIESYNGTRCFRSNNIAGWFTDKNFESKEDCIIYTSRKIREWYLTEPHECDDNCIYVTATGHCQLGQYYNGYTFSDIIKRYSPKDDGTFNQRYVDMATWRTYNMYQIALG